jgi:hypothetical protein
LLRFIRFQRDFTQGKGASQPISNIQCYGFCYGFLLRFGVFNGRLHTASGTERQLAQQPRSNIQIPKAAQQRQRLWHSW